MADRQPTGPVEVINDGPDATARTVAWSRTFEFMPTAGVAYLQVDILYSVLGSAAAGYILGCGIDHIDVWVGGSVLYTVRDWTVGMPAGAAARDALPAAPAELISETQGRGGQLTELNRFLFYGGYEEHMSTVSCNATTNVGTRSFKLPVYKPNVGVKNQKIKVVIWFAAPTQWCVTGAGMTATVTSMQVIIACQYADQMPEFEYINYGRIGIGASLNKSYDVALDEKKGKFIIGVINDFTMAGAFLDHLTRMYLVDTNGNPWTQMTREQMKNEVNQRSNGFWVKTGATTGVEVIVQNNVGCTSMKVDGVESNGKVKIAIDTNATAAAGILNSLVLLRTEGTPAATVPGKQSTMSAADQSGAVAKKG